MKLLDSLKKIFKKTLDSESKIEYNKNVNEIKQNEREKVIKMEVKEMNKVREDFLSKISDSEMVEGYEYIGRITEGLLFQDENGESVVVRVIVKKEDFDAEDALEEYKEKEAKAKERAAKSAEKAAKAQKAKAEKEKAKSEKEKKAE